MARRSATRWSDLIEEDDSTTCYPSKADVDYSTTVGGDSDPESIRTTVAASGATCSEAATSIYSATTVVPSMADAESSGDDMETSVGTASSQRTSASRPSNHRGPARKMKKAQRSEQRALLRKGSSFVPSDVMLAEKAEKRKDMDRAVSDAQKLAEPSFSLRRFMDVPADFKVDARLSTECHKRVFTEAVTMLSYCHACNCPIWGGKDPHLGGRRHRIAMEVMTALNMLMGLPASGASARTYGQGLKIPRNTKCDWRDVVAYWGTGLEKFGLMCWAKTLEAGVLIKPSQKKGTLHIPREHIAGCSVVVVNYDGIHEGVYGARHSMMWPSSFPRSFEEDVQLWPLAIVSFKKGFFIDAPFKKPEAEPHAKVAPPAQGPPEDPWDPCKTGVLVAGEKEYTELAEIGELTSMSTSSDGWRNHGVWAICAYQATESPATAWPLRVERA